MDDRLLAALVALVAYILWRRGIVQAAWHALFSGGSQRQTGDVSGWASGLLANAVATAPPANPSPSTPSNPSASPSPDAAIIGAIPQGLTATIAQYGSDLWNYCLAFVNKTRAIVGRSGGAYTDATAHDACAQLVLHPGVAPPGATVCFAGNPGHIGIANGGDSYTSAGLIHGGLSVGPYVNNPNYMGFAL